MKNSFLAAVLNRKQTEFPFQCKQDYQISPPADFCFRSKQPQVVLFHLALRNFKHIHTYQSVASSFQKGLSQFNACLFLATVLYQVTNYIGCYLHPFDYLFLCIYLDWYKLIHRVIFFKVGQYWYLTTIRFRENFQQEPNFQIFLQILMKFLKYLCTLLADDFQFDA